MRKRVFISGLAGAIVLLAWTFVINGLLGFNARFSMKQVPNEREVYATLKAAITEPGRYLCNPALTPEGRYPDREPVFGVQYAGVGHEAAGFAMILGFLQFLLAPWIGAWLLSRTSEKFRSRFANRLGFFAILGVLAALTGDIGSCGIGGSPLAVALLFAARTVVTWTLVGLAVASAMGRERRPEPAR